MSAPVAFLIFLVMQIVSFLTLMTVTQLDGWM